MDASDELAPLLYPGPRIALLRRFARLLQEFRVAQFAPELGTAEKVSPPRLQAAWETAEPGLE